MPDPIDNFGIGFPPETSLIERRMHCAYHGVGAVPRWKQRKEIIRSLWADDVYSWTRWDDRRMKGMTDYNWVTWAGPGGSAKTTSAAVQGLAWWLEAPHISAVIVCSTDIKMLRKRIWGQMAHFHQQLYARFGTKLGNLGKLIDSETLIRWKDGDNKHGIFGLAVADGPVEQAINALIGIHPTRLMLILDEMQGVREAILGATRNMAKNPVFRFLGIGNPESFQDPLGRHSEPVNGWDSIKLGETEEWETVGGPVAGGGLCQFFDGRKSPADDSPEERKRLPWLINRDWVAAHLKSVGGNENDPSYLSQAVGIWPAAGVDNTVLDEQIITTFQCKKAAVWTQRKTAFAALDPAFEGSDMKVLQFGHRGITEMDGKPPRWVVEFGDWVKVPIDSNSEEPLHFQIVSFVKRECQKRGIPPDEVAIDSTGEGGGILSIFHREWGPVIGVEFGGRPSDLPVSETNPKPSHEEYDRRASELNLSIRTFATLDALRGLSEEAASQACARRTEYKGKKMRVETKKEMRKRIGRSPDNLDAVAVGIDLCRQKGVVPASNAPAKAGGDWAKQAREAAAVFDDSAYLESEYAL